MPHLTKRDQQLSISLERLISQLDRAERISADPVRFPRRFEHSLDREVVSLFTALLSYGRVKAIGQAVESLLSCLDGSPAKLAIQDAQHHRETHQTPHRFDGFIYRFTRGEDLNKLWLGIGEVLLRHGSIGAQLRQADDLADDTLITAYSGLYHAVIDYSAPLPTSRGFNHLFSNPKGGSALKRVNMWLRWMVRGPDDVDFGIYADLNPARLIIPLDVHIFRLSRALGLTQRRTPDLKTAQQITQRLKRLSPDDPTRFDFALAHLGISKACLGYQHPDVCPACPLVTLCALPKQNAAHSN